jgi:hypothetical protein
MTHQDQRASLASGPFSQYLGYFRRPVQMPGDLRLDALSLEVIGNAVETCGEYAKPSAQQNHMTFGC